MMSDDEEDAGVPPSGGRILVAIGASPNSAHLIRWARQSASALRCPWSAVHIDSGSTLSREDEERLEAHLALARRLGAETTVLRDPDVARGVVEAARREEASMIVIGRSGLSRLGPIPKRATVSDRIVREAGAIDVAVIQDSSGPRRDLTLQKLGQLFAAPPRQYLLLAFAFILLSALGLLVEPAIGYRSLALVFLAVVVGLSFLAKPAPVALFAVLSALSLDFLFISPQFTLSISTLDDLFLFAAYFVVAFATGILVARLRSEGRRLAEREAMSSFLISSTRRLAAAADLDKAVGEALAALREHFGSQAFAFLAAEQGGLSPWAGNVPFPDAALLEAASGAFAHGEAVEGGQGLRHFPAMTGERPVAVLSVGKPAGKSWTKNDDSLVFSLARTLALIIERERSEARSRKAALEEESGRLAKILLDSVSHELRTPLTTVTGSLSALGDERLASDPARRGALVDGALEAADRLNRLVEDILSVSRMESKAFALSLAQVDVADLANEALDAARPELEESRVMLELPQADLVVRVDPALVARLAANLLRNAARYSPPGTPIGFVLEARGKDLRIAVRDRGPGVPEAELASIFERFRRGTKAAGGGLGLGLAICKGIAGAHGGTIAARNIEGGGLEVLAVLPACVEEVQP